MTPVYYTKTFWLLVAGCICLVFVSLLPIMLSPELPAGALDLRMADRPQMTSGAMLFTLVLSNGTSRTLNIVDDTAGKPFFVLDDGSPAPGTIGVGLSTLANMLKINLAPGQALTNGVMLTNPPPRFRFRVEVRDLASERRAGVKTLFHIVASKVTFRKPTPYSSSAILLPASDWIEPGNISTTTPPATVPNTNPQP